MKPAYDVKVREIFVVRGFTLECSGRRGFRRYSRLSVPAVGASEGIPVKETPEHVHSMQRLGP